MRVALVHDWLTGMRGGEKVLEAICEVFPGAPLYTFVHVRGSVSPVIEARPIVTSPAQRLPSAGRWYRHYLPLYPLLVELFDLERFDLVVSTSHCAVKSVIRAPGAVHVCYCHSPMRYAWDQFESYFGAAQVGRVASTLLRPVMRRLARWDAATAGRVDRFLSNSQYVAGRIRRYYNRGSITVYPPVDTDFYTPAPSPGSSAFVIVSALVPYKRVDVAIESCRRLGAPLKIVGTGPELQRLKAIAGPGVEFLGWQPQEAIRQLLRESRAALLPGVEDFGIVPVEAQACGCPVVALDAGGARETVVDGVTGVLVPDGSAEAFADGLRRVRELPRDVEALRTNALRFSRQQFLSRFRQEVEAAVEERSGAARRPPSPQQAPRENAADAARRPPSPQQAPRENVADAARRPPSPQQAPRENEQ